VAFTGNPAHLNFGKGLGKVGFFSGDGKSVQEEREEKGGMREAGAGAGEL
jgi:hypothetical protein